MPVNPTTLKRIFILVSGLIAFSIPLPIRINSIFIVSVFIFFLLVLIKEKWLDRNLLSTEALLMISLFTIASIGLAYTSNLSQGLNDLERSAFSIAFLLIVYQFKKLNISVFKLIIAFASGCFAIILYGLGYAFIKLNADQQKQIFESGHTYFADIILIHPVYLSIYFIFIFFFL